MPASRFAPVRAALWLGALLVWAGAAGAQDGVFALRSLTPETALAAAQAALARCRADGYQVAVALVDRSGLTQVLLRDRFAGPHTLTVAQDKAWTALSFRTPTGELATLTQPGQSMSGLRGLPRVMAIGGGLTVEGGGSLLGAIGVSGAPGGAADEACAKAGIAAIADRIDF